MNKDSIICNLEKLKQCQNIRELYLFGSVARGEDDKYSDVDILVVIDDCSEEDFEIYKKKFSELVNVPATWLSVYRRCKIKKMVEQGSYFLWHIKSEGVLIYSKDEELRHLLEKLPKYKGVLDDLGEYSQIVEDVKKELEDIEMLDCSYELSVLASVVRNTCIAIMYLRGKMLFGRISPVKSVIMNYNLDFSIDEYENLYLFRLYTTGKLHEEPKADIRLIYQWISRVGNLLDIAKKEVLNYERKNK